MLEKLKAVEFDAQTGSVVERELTKEEIELHQTAVQQTIDADAALDAKIAARQSALSKLAALGLTEEEIAAL
jgi:predicted RNA-binding protein with PIN domain